MKLQTFRKIKNFKNIFNLFIKYMDENTAKLFPEINPNVEEIIEMEKKIDPEAVIVEEKTSSNKHEDIFVSKSKKGEKVKKNVKFKVDENVKLSTTEKKDKYAHLAAARQKGIETRRRKAAERKAAKEKLKAEKEEAKRLKREATMQRNRDKAKARYYREKEKKDQKSKSIQQQIIKDTKPPQNTYKEMVSTHNRQQNNMDFNTFAKYMMKYENMKEAYNKQKQKKIEKKVEKKVEKKQQPYNSNNYPLAHLYNPHLRNQNNYF